MLTYNNITNGFQVNSECTTAKINDAEGTRFATAPQIGMIGMVCLRLVRVGVVGRSIRLVGNHTYFCAIQE